MFTFKICIFSLLFDVEARANGFMHSVTLKEKKTHLLSETCLFTDQFVEKHFSDLNAASLPDWCLACLDMRYQSSAATTWMFSFGTEQQ